MKKTKNTYIEVILKNLQENKKIYILLLIFLLIGIVLGVFFINNSDEAQKNEVSEYINNFVTTLKNNNSIDKNELINVSFKKKYINGNNIMVHRFDYYWFTTNIFFCVV